MYTIVKLIKYTFRWQFCLTSSINSFLDMNKNVPKIGQNIAISVKFHKTAKLIVFSPLAFLTLNFKNFLDCRLSDGLHPVPLLSGWRRADCMPNKFGRVWLNKDYMYSWTWKWIFRPSQCWKRFMVVPAPLPLQPQSMRPQFDPAPYY